MSEEKVLDMMERLELFNNKDKLNDFIYAVLFNRGIITGEQPPGKDGA